MCSKAFADVLRSFTTPRGVYLQTAVELAADRYVMLARTDPRHHIAIGVPGELVRENGLQYAARAAWIELMNRLSAGFPEVPTGHAAPVEMLHAEDHTPLAGTPAAVANYV